MALDMDRIARTLGAVRLGKVQVRGGVFGAMAVAREHVRIQRTRASQIAMPQCTCTGKFADPKCPTHGSSKPW
jgi:hypothetical protein